MNGRGVGGWAVLAVALGLLGCREPARMWQVEATALFEPQTLDFGEVPVGEWREQAVKIRNVGDAPFNALDALELGHSPSFEVQLDKGERIGPGEEREVLIRFHPLREGLLEELVYVDVDAEHRPDPEIPVRGVGAPLPIEVWPAVIDFEILEVDSDRSLPVTVKNPVDLPLTIQLVGEGADQFDTNGITVEPHQTLTFDARYFPRLLGPSGAKLEIRPCETCTAAQTELKGTAVPFAFVFSPEPVPFDDIPVHERTRSVSRARNVTWRPVTIQRVSTSDESFRPLTDLDGHEVGAGEEVELEVEFAARYSGPAVGTMRFDYQSDRARIAQVVLDATGGRPQLSLTPVSIDFGDLPVGGKGERVVRMTNAGTTGALSFLGVRGQGQAEHFNVSAPFRGKTTIPWSGGAWPALDAPGVEIQPGADFLDVKVFFEPNVAGEFRAELVFRSDDMFSPERVVVLTGRSHTIGPCTFRVLPSTAIDFGALQVGKGAVLGFRFENPGPNECAVKNIRISNTAGGAFAMPGGEITGGVLLPDTAFSAMVSFRAIAEGTFEGALELTVSNPVTPKVVLPLRGVGRQSCLAAAPPFIDFGPVRYDCSTRPLTTYVSNQCTGPITVDKVWIGEGTSDQFTLSRAPVLPLTLAPREGFEVEGTFARTLLGQHYSPLYVRQQGDPNPFMVPLLAETNHDGLLTERFVQGTDNQLDVLFVVSNASTMAPYQDRLKAEIPGWISAARSKNVDLRIGVTTTGLVPRSSTCPGGVAGGEAGRLFPVNHARPRVLQSQSTSAPSLLQENLGVGICHNLVQGLETMRQALSTPLVDRADDPRTPEPSDGNLGLVRPQARLAVVVLADEDDHSGFDAVSYQQFLRSLKGPGMGHRVALHAIVPTDPACKTASPPGPRFAEVAKGTGGEVLSVCASDYGALLDRIAGRAAGPQRDFRLAEVPTDTNEIYVLVNGVEQDRALWRFDSSTNSIVFEQAAVPTPGQTVSVRYRAICKG